MVAEISEEPQEPQISKVLCECSHYGGHAGVPIYFLHNMYFFDLLSIGGSSGPKYHTHLSINKLHGTTQGFQCGSQWFSRKI